MTNSPRVLSLAILATLAFGASGASAAADSAAPASGPTCVHADFARRARKRFACWPAWSPASRLPMFPVGFPAVHDKSFVLI